MKNGVVLLDRDGTINVETNYLTDPDRLVLLPKALSGMRKMRDAGCELIVITNQSAIGRGYCDAQTVEAVHQRLRDLLAAGGVSLRGVYVCPHSPTAGCLCRKPARGMVDHAARDHGFDPKESVVIGDKACDVELARRVGATRILVATG